MTEFRRDQRAPELIGRAVEADRLYALLDGLPDRGGSLLLRGEAGIGKSALLGLVRDRAKTLGFTPLVTAGVEAEAELAFAGLHQLLVPVMRSVNLLPASQHRAIDAAFGMSDDVHPDPFRFAMAVFRLITAAADSNPLVLLVDDAHWLDRSSLVVLAFVARRLEDAPVAMVATVRSGYATPFDDARLTTVDLDRLSAQASALLVDRAAPGLHPVSRARVLAEAAGNPLALVELPRTAPYAPPTPKQIAPAPTTLNARLEQAFASRLRELPEETRAVLLAAALDGRVSFDETVRSASLVLTRTVSLEAFEPAVEAGLIELGGSEIQFRHPLIRSAVREAASTSQVLAMYGVLGDLVDDPERRLWHRAAAARGADEALASALEDHALAARRRGAVAAAGAALERAAALTPDPRNKARRLVRAAEVAYELGLVDAVRQLLEEIEPRDLELNEDARRAWLNEMISGNVWLESGATRNFVAIARRVAEAGDSEYALRSLVPIAHRCWWTRTQPRTRQFLVAAASEMNVAEEDPRLLAVLAMADPEVTGGSVLHRLSGLRLADLPDPVDKMHAGIAAEKAGDFQLGARILAAAVQDLRAQIRLVPLTQALVHYAWAAVQVGDWDAAAAAGDEAASLSRDTRQPQYGVTGELMAALARALAGATPDLELRLAESERTIVAIRSPPLLTTARLARGAAAIGEGRYEDAWQHLLPVFDESETFFHRYMRWCAVLDIVEAAARSGHNAHVTPVVEELEAIASRSAPPILCTMLTCARPLLAPDDEAEALFAAALRLDATPYPFLRARVLLSLGTWLRRQRRSADARGPLRRSVEMFDTLGAAAWGRRARQELRATGETVGPRTPDARDRLTAQELQIAQMAADGLSNREIGERLFLSHRTIGSHLYRIYPKLGITSRQQLGESLVGGATG